MAQQNAGVPDSGRQRILELAAERVGTIAVGLESNPSDYNNSDTSLSSSQSDTTEISTDTQGAAAFVTTPGPNLVCEITISGGLEVPAGSDVTEIGAFMDDGSMVYREVLDSPITFPQGIRRTIQFEINY